MKKSKFLKNVRLQYEKYPYPPRDPNNEKIRLRATEIDDFETINHYCYQGKKKIKSDFRPLVAGCGTGDSVIYLAEQLRDTDAEIVAMDISEASIEIAKSRADVRKLKNIKWLNQSIFDIPDLSLGNFDYINCTGVLHHLEDPVKALRILASVLKKEGCMGLMVYGKYGRTGIYHIQNIMKMVNQDEKKMHIKIRNTKSVLASLPFTNWFKLDKNFGNREFDDITLYDLFLHSQDIPLDVLTLYDLIEKCNLNWVSFYSKQLLYCPRTYFKDSEILYAIESKPKKIQEAICEIVNGSINLHTFYVSKNLETVASIHEFDNVLFWRTDNGRKMAEMLIKDPSCSVTIKNSAGITAMFHSRPLTIHCIKYINNNNTIKEILNLAEKSILEVEGRSVSQNEIFQSLMADYEVLFSLDTLRLRNKNVDSLKSAFELQQPISQKYKTENQTNSFFDDDDIVNFRPVI